MLVVEDDRSCQILIQRMLSSLGYQVDIVADALNALERLEQITYDIVWLDIRLPRLDGFQAVRLIRERFPSTRCPYIVALTANVYAIGERAFLQAGMDDYVSKPYQKEDLIEAVNLFTQKRQLPGMCQRR